MAESFTRRHSCCWGPVQPHSGACAESVSVGDFTTHSLLLMCKTIFLLLTALCLMDGRILESDKFDYSPIDLGKIEAGTYFLRLSTPYNEIFKTVKIIKQ